MVISQKHSDGFRGANLIATILIVAIHYNSKMYITPSELGGWNYLVQEFITNGIARIAVPFFALSSGIFYYYNYCGVSSYIKQCKKRFWSLLVPYVVGSAIIMLLDNLLLSVIHGVDYNVGFLVFIRGVTFEPYPYQLWFVKDLIVLSLCSPIIIFFTKYTKNIYLCVLLICWIVNYNILPKLFGLYFVNIETLFFFSLGCFFVKNNKLFSSLFENNKKTTGYVFLVVSIIIFAIRVTYDPEYQNSNFVGFSGEVLFSAFCQKSAILIGVYALIIMSSELNFKNLLYMSGFTFFVYIYHAAPLFRFVIKSGSFVVQDKYLFYYGFPVATVVVFAIAIFLNLYLPKIFLFLTGNRRPIAKTSGRLNE